MALIDKAARAAWDRNPPIPWDRLQEEDRAERIDDAAEIVRALAKLGPPDHIVQAFATTPSGGEKIRKLWRAACEAILAEGGYEL